jgi:hypothetical protein
VERPRDRFASVGRPGPTAFSRILVGFTADHDAGATLGLAGRLAQRDGARLTIVAATAPHIALRWSPLGAAHWQALQGELATRLHRIAQALPSDIGVTHSVIEGQLAGAISRTLQDESFDLLVLPPSATRSRAVRRVLRRSSVPLRQGPC